MTKNVLDGTAELVALKCRSCSGQLPDFESGFSRCPACATLHYLKGFVVTAGQPAPSKDADIVEIPPVLAIGMLLRENNIIANNDDESDYDDNRESDVCEKFMLRLETYRDRWEEPLRVCTYLEVGEIHTNTVQENVVVEEGNFLGWGRKEELRPVDHHYVYFPYQIRFDRETEAPVVMNVYGTSYIQGAQRIKELIKSKLGYTIRIRLVNS
jgi:hypothetical protein